MLSSNLQVNETIMKFFYAKTLHVIFIKVTLNICNCEQCTETETEEQAC